MSIESDEPFSVIPICTEDPNPALATCLDDSFTETRRLREGGWDGPKMAAFIATLAQTGIVRDACRACDISAKSAYALRHRDPVFTKAWEAALDMARHRLADELLARSLKGSAEALLRDGAIVAERQHFDNKLAFSILRRLDRRAELGATFKSPPQWEVAVPAPAVSGEWQEMLDALAEDRPADAARLLGPGPAKDEQGNTEGNNPLLEGDTDDHDDGEPEVRERIWQAWPSDEWRTDFPPPPGFDGDEYGDWDDAEGYSRTLTGAEFAALAAAGLADAPPEKATIEEDSAERDAFFAALSARA